MIIMKNLGRPRTVLAIGPDVRDVERMTRDRGVDVVHVEGMQPSDVELATGDRKFDLAVVGDALRNGPNADVLARVIVSRLTDGGHVLAASSSIAGLEGDLPARLRAAGLEIMRVDLEGPLPARPLPSVVRKLASHAGVLVARVRPKKGKLSLTVGMLTLNEEESVERMIDDIRQYAPDANILLIDSSSDKTPDLARAKGATVIRQLPPRGHGPAMERLMYEAANQSDALIYLDCDFTYPAEVIPRIRQLLEDGADVVNASRTHHYPKAMPVPNFLANRLFAATAQLVHGVPTTDVHSGMRGYRSSMTRAFSFSGEGDALPIDTLVLPARSNYEVVEMPIPYQERVGQSKLAKFRGTVWTFARIARCVGEGERVRRGHNYRHVEL